MWLTHHPRIVTFNDTVEWLGVFMDNAFDCTENNATESVTVTKENSFGKGRVRGHMICLPHLPRIFTFFSMRFVMGPGNQTKKNSQPTNQPINQPPTQHPLQRCCSGVEHDERNDPWVQTPISFWTLSPSSEQQLVGMKPSCSEASLVLTTTSATIPRSNLRSDLEPCFP